MKLFIKFSFLASILTLSTMLLMGCSTNELQVYNSYIKSLDINSMEAKSNVTLHFSAEGVPEESKSSVASAAQVLNNLKLNIDSKLNRSEDNKIAKGQYEGEVEIGGIGTKFGLWVDSDLTGENPKIKEIFKVPTILTASLPEKFVGKEYIVMDIEKMQKYLSQNDLSQNELSLNEIANTSVEVNKFIHTELVNFLNTYGKQFNSGVNFVTKKESNKYEVKFDDSSFKAFLRYLVNNADENKTSIKNILKDYLNLATKIAKDDSTSEDIDAMLAGFDSGTGDFKTNCNSTLDALKDVKILGEKGIVITYTLNNDGYIINESGTIDLVIDIGKLYSALNNDMYDLSVDASDNQGIYKITLDINTDISNINKDVQIVLPTLTSDNSFEYTDMIQYFKEEMQRQSEASMAEYLKNKNIDVLVDNEDYIYYNTPPKIVNGSVMVPMRETFAELGAKIQWNPKTQTVTAVKENKKIIIKVKSKTATVNGKVKTLTVPATMIEGKVFVPVRFVSESLGAKVEYDAHSKIVYITTE